LGIPVVVTEQYVKGLGETLPVIREKLTEPRLEKMTFSCCGDSGFLASSDPNERSTDGRPSRWTDGRHRARPATVMANE
jgi:hypothetical protein